MFETDGFCSIAPRRSTENPTISWSGLLKQMSRTIKAICVMEVDVDGLTYVHHTSACGEEVFGDNMQSGATR